MKEFYILKKRGNLKQFEIKKKYFKKTKNKILLNNNIKKKS